MKNLLKFVMASILLTIGFQALAKGPKITVIEDGVEIDSSSLNSDSYQTVKEGCTQTWDKSNPKHFYLIRYCTSVYNGKHAMNYAAAKAQANAGVTIALDANATTRYLGLLEHNAVIAVTGSNDEGLNHIRNALGLNQEIQAFQTGNYNLSGLLGVCTAQNMANNLCYVCSVMDAQDGSCNPGETVIGARPTK